MAALLLAGCVAGIAFASAPRVGALPDGPVTNVLVREHARFTIMLPKPKVAGRVWRVARPYNAKVVREVGERDTKAGVSVTYRGVAPGKTRIVFALTRGERHHAFAARTWVVTVRKR